MVLTEPQVGYKFTPEVLSWINGLGLAVWNSIGDEVESKNEEYLDAYLVRSKKELATFKVK